MSTDDHLEAALDDLPLRLTPTEVAEACRANVQTVYRWLKSGELVGYKLNGWVILRADLIAFLRTRRSHPQDPGAGAEDVIS